MSNYQQFIESKKVAAHSSGFLVNLNVLHPSHYPHQRDCIAWALRGGRRAIFAGFGLGKTRMQLEICRQEYLRFLRPCLIICPLGVRQEFMEFDGPVLGMRLEYIKSEAEAILATTPYHITNYERIRDGTIDLAATSVFVWMKRPVCDRWEAKHTSNLMNGSRSYPPATWPRLRLPQTILSSCSIMLASWASWMWVRLKPGSFSATAKKPIS